MFKQSIKALYIVAHQKLRQIASVPALSHNLLKGFITATHHTLLLVGAGALILLALFAVKPDAAAKLQAFSPFPLASVEEVDAAEPALTTLMDVPNQPFSATTNAAVALGAATPTKVAHKSQEQQQLVTNWLSKRYRVAGDATNMLVSAAYTTAEEFKMDPLLVLSVIAIESGFNPFAESPVGAQGLMQVMSKIHYEKFEDLGGIKAALNPVANIRVGTMILRNYVKRGGSVEAGLKYYVGAAAFETDFGYGAKVLAEYRRLKEVAQGKKVPIYSNAPIKTVQKTPTPDAIEDPKLVPDEENKSASSDQPARQTKQFWQVAKL